MRSASGVKWDAGLQGVFEPLNHEGVNLQDTSHYTTPLSQSLDIKEVMREKLVIGDFVDPNTLHVIVLSYDSYCRMRALLKRLEGIEEEAMKSRTVRALGGFVVPSRKTKLLFCRDVFEYPELEGHELLCNHLAPKLQSRPNKLNFAADSESESSETSEDRKPRLIMAKKSLMIKSNSLIRGMNKSSSIRPIPSTKHNKATTSHSRNIRKDNYCTPALDRLIEVDFMSKLHKFMQDRNTAINRIPFIGSKQLNVFDLFTRVQQLGGYEVVITKKLWRHLYEDLIGKHCPPSQSQNLQFNINQLKKHYERILLPYEIFLLQEQQRILGIDLNKYNTKSQRLLPKHQRQRNLSRMPTFQSHNKLKEDPGEPSVSILQVPKVNLETVVSDLSRRPEITITPIPRAFSNTPGLSSLQLADLMSLNVNLSNSLSVSALQDFAKIAECYDHSLMEPSPKKFKYDDGGSRMNGSRKDKSLVPDLVSADHLLRQMNDSKLLLPAHQSTKTISALAALLPQTSIFPAPAPAAHQHIKMPSKPLMDKPEPVFQSLSVYSQSKNIYGKPTITKDDRSPEIEILDLRVANDSRNDRLELELLDLSTRRDITVSAVPKPSTSRNLSVKIPPPQVSIRSMDKSSHWNRGGLSMPVVSSKSPPAGNSPMNALASAFTAQGIPPAALVALGPQVLNYIMSSAQKQSVQHQQLPMFPDVAMLSHYYSMMPGMMSPNAGGGSVGNAAVAAAAVQQAAVAAQLAQLNSLGLGTIPGLSMEAIASLGIYKNYLPQGSLPPPHFLSGLMSPQNPSPSK